MKKILFILLLVISSVVEKSQAQTPTPFTSKIINTSGNLISPHFARICPSTTGTATLQAIAGWPFGVGYAAVTDLHIALHNVVTIPNGAIADYNSITIDSGGVLQITGGPNWTYIGCKGAFILNGAIVGKGSPAGIYPTHFPAGNGDTTGIAITYTLVQDSGGDGGASGNSYSSRSYGNQPSIYSGAVGGYQYGGNGGGGGSGFGLQYQGDCACWTANGVSNPSIGGNGTDSTSGYGAPVEGGPVTPAVNVYSQNGNIGQSGPAASNYNQPSSGGSGGTRGMHGNLIFIQAMAGISGNGIIDVRGNAGGNGGGSVVGYCCSGSGDYSSNGGGGGGAGGSGGYVYINYVGNTLPSAQVLVAGGAGGIGGTSGANGGQGQSGVNGDTGTYGVYTANLLAHGYTFQWRKFANNISGATTNTYTATAGGVYDCKIIDLQNNIHYTSIGGGGFDDTVAVDNQPVAQITSFTSPICEGQTATFTANYTLGDSLQWYVYNVFLGSYSPVSLHTTGTTFTTSTAGQYQVWAFNTCNTNGDTSTSQTLVVHPGPTTPTVTAIGTTTFCPGGSVELHSSSSTNNMWSVNAGSATTQTVSVNQSGYYKVTVSNSFSCTSTSDSVNVTVLPASLGGLRDTNITCGSFIQLNAIAVPTPTLVAWVSSTPNTFLNNTSVLNPVCTPSTSVNYTVTANFGNGCSAKDTFRVINNPSANPAICMVSTDTLSKHNIIYWNNTSFPHVDSFIVYRESSTNNFLRIGAVSKDSSRLVDTDSSFGGAHGGNPNYSTYQYKMQILDTCGNYSALSPYHNTIFISNNSGTFTWNTYSVGSPTYTPVQNYILLRDNFSNGVWDSIAVTAGNQNTLSDPNYSSYQSTASWRIDATGFNNCNIGERLINPNSPFATRVKSHSNTSARTGQTTGINQVSGNNNQVAVYPNPTNGVFNIRLSNYDNTSIEVYDAIGNKVFMQTLQTNINQLDISTYANGMYQLRVLKNNTSVYQTKISKVD